MSCFGPIRHNINTITTLVLSTVFVNINKTCVKLHECTVHMPYSHKLENKQHAESLRSIWRLHFVGHTKTSLRNTMRGNPWNCVEGEMCLLFYTILQLTGRFITKLHSVLVTDLWSCSKLVIEYHCMAKVYTCRQGKPICGTVYTFHGE